MTKVHKNRLLKLAAFLRELPRKKFDIGGWKYEDEKCGTVCCAAGWACSIPSFRRAGLRMENNSYYERPVYQDLSDFEAVTEFFGISCDDADELFTYLGYGHLNRSPTPKDVAKKIEQHVKVATSPAAKAYKADTGRDLFTTPFDITAA